MRLTKDPHQLDIFNESKRRRVYVGRLSFSPASQQFCLRYEEDYLLSPSAIPIGVELSLHKAEHLSPPGELFPAFLDRIPSQQNPAYPDYCRAQGIDVNESNPIVLLGTIGRRGPSTLIFEAVYCEEVINIANVLKDLRERLALSRWDLSVAFDIPELTILRIEAGECRDSNIHKLLYSYLHNRELALWQLALTGKRLHVDVLNRLFDYFDQLAGL